MYSPHCPIEVSLCEVFFSETPRSVFATWLDSSCSEPSHSYDFSPHDLDSYASADAYLHLRTCVPCSSVSAYRSDDCALCNFNLRFLARFIPDVVKLPRFDKFYSIRFWPASKKLKKNYFTKYHTSRIRIL